MCIACQYVPIFEHRGRHGFTLGIIDLHDGGRGIAEELGVVELMSPIFLSVEGETAIAEGELAVGLSGCNLVGQDTTHRVFTFVGHDALAQVHHATTLCHDVSDLY